MDSSQNVFWTRKDSGDYDSRAFDSGRIKAHQWIAVRAKSELEKENTVSMELGCGTGIFAKTIGLRNIIGVDFSPSMLEIARKRMNEVWMKDVFQLRLEENSVDNVITLFVVSDYPRVKKRVLFKQIFSYLKPGGHFFFSAYSPNDGYFRDLDEIKVKEGGESFTLHLEDESYYLDIFSDIGFDILESEVLKIPTVLERDSRVAKAGSRLDREFIVLVAIKPM